MPVPPLFQTLLRLTAVVSGCITRLGLHSQTPVSYCLYLKVLLSFEKYFLLKNIMVGKNLRGKKILVQKIFVEKKSWWKKICGRKKILVEKNLGQKFFV